MEPTVDDLEDDLQQLDAQDDLEEGKEQPPTDNESALQHNIRRKGSNSYYYAHGHKVDAPAWDGQQEPRLLRREESKDGGPVRAEPITSYAWADEKKKVKIYITYENADALPDESFELESTDTTLLFRINQEGAPMKVLNIPNLYDEIEGVQWRKKPDKIVITLSKKKDFSWHQLKK